MGNDADAQAIVDQLVDDLFNRLQSTAPIQPVEDPSLMVESIRAAAAMSGAGTEVQGRPQ